MDKMKERTASTVSTIAEADIDVVVKKTWRQWLAHKNVRIMVTGIFMSVLCLAFLIAIITAAVRASNVVLSFISHITAKE